MIAHRPTFINETMNPAPFLPISMLPSFCNTKYSSPSFSCPLMLCSVSSLYALKPFRQHGCGYPSQLAAKQRNQSVKRRNPTDSRDS